MTKRAFNTRAIHERHAGFEPDSMPTPIYQSVACPYTDAQEAAAISAGERPGFTYRRWDNPTVQVFEERMAALAGTEVAIATSSGMAAIFMVAHHLVEAGDEIVSSNRVHGGTFGLAQMKGSSSLMSFELKGTYEDAVKVIDSLELLLHATHLGTCKTIVTHPASTPHAAMGPEELRKAGIAPTLIRISVGLEDQADIIADIEQALAKVAGSDQPRRRKVPAQTV